MRKYALFFWLAALPSLLSLKDQPASSWGWWLYTGAALYQGLLAMKALQSSPSEREDAPAEVKIINDKTEPVQTEEV